MYNEDIITTVNPVKTLGIYIGHNKKLCQEKNWTGKINQITNILDN